MRFFLFGPFCPYLLFGYGCPPILPKSFSVHLSSLAWTSQHLAVICFGLTFNFSHVCLRSECWGNWVGNTKQKAIKPPCCVRYINFNLMVITKNYLKPTFPFTVGYFPLGCDNCPHFKWLDWRIQDQNKAIFLFKYFIWNIRGNEYSRRTSVYPKCHFQAVTPKFGEFFFLKLSNLYILLNTI